jgi:hypothetical protein
MLMGLFFTASGVFTISAAAMNWDWFMNHRKAWLFVKLLGRQGARLLYGVIGISLVVLGILTLTGVIDAS